MTFYEQAREKLAKDKITGSKAAAMAPAVKEALLNFAGQDEEFAQAIVQGGSFSACMAEVARGVGQAISDLEAFGKAAAFYFPKDPERPDFDPDHCEARDIAPDAYDYVLGDWLYSGGTRERIG